MPKVEIKTRFGIHFCVAVDEEDLVLLVAHKWHLSEGYVARSIRLPDRRRVKELFHRRIMGLEYGDRRQVDHINGNQMDCRKENLRICEQRNNLLNQRKRSDNTSGFKGVSRCKGKWRSEIRISTTKRIHLGLFDTKEEAHEAYKTAALKYHKDFKNFG